METLHSAVQFYLCSAWLQSAEGQDHLAPMLYFKTLFKAAADQSEIVVTLWVSTNRKSNRLFVGWKHQIEQCYLLYLQSLSPFWQCEKQGHVTTGQNHHSSYLMGWCIRFLFRKTVQQSFNEILLFLSCRYRHLLFFLCFVQKEFLEQTMALLHKNGSVKSLELFLLKFLRRSFTKKYSHTMFWWPFRLYKTSKWKTLNTMKQLQFFRVSSKSGAV